VRLFDYESGEVLCCISNLPKAVLCMTKANSNQDFAFGSADYRVRMMEMRKGLVQESVADSNEYA